MNNYAYTTLTDCQTVTNCFRWLKITRRHWQSEPSRLRQQICSRCR